MATTMKASDRPKLSADWWEDKCPPDLDRKPLARALEGYEKVSRRLERKRDDIELIQEALDLLKSLEGAVKKTIKECDRKKHKHVIRVLRRFDGLLEDEEERLIEQEKELTATAHKNGEADDDGLLDRDVLYTRIRMIKSGKKRLNFAFGLNANDPEDSDLLLHPKLSEYRLYKILKKSDRYPKRMMTYGVAENDLEDSATLVFRLAPSADEPPRIIKQGRLFLRSDKKLKFNKLRLVLPNGRIVKEEEQEEQDANGQDSQAQNTKGQDTNNTKGQGTKERPTTGQGAKEQNSTPPSDRNQRSGSGTATGPTRGDEQQGRSAPYTRANGDARKYMASVLQTGSRGKAVSFVQGRLNFSLGSSLAEDGVYGPKTLDVIKAFQKSRGISADGIVGPATWGLLDAAGLKMDLE